MSNLIKEGYFILSTMLNLKSLWMYQLNTSKPEHKQQKHEFQSSSYVQMEISELGVTYLSALTTCM